jgi:hypothetical protein
MADELKMPRRTISKKLGVPLSTTEPVPRLEASERGLLEALAENYRVNPGLYMTREDVKERLAAIPDSQLDKLFIALEAKDMVKLHKDKRGTVLMARASHKGLKEAKPLDFYRWFPDWLDKDYIF